MKIIGLLIGIITAMGIILSGCEPVTPDQIKQARSKLGYESELPKVDVNRASVFGNWKASCIQDSEKLDFYRIDEVQFGKDEFELATEFFFDSDCLKKAFKQSFQGDYLLTSNQLLANFSNFFVIPESSIIVASFNLKSYCGLTDWTWGVIKNITNFESCGSVSKLSSKITRYGETEMFIDSRKYLRQ